MYQILVKIVNFLLIIVTSPGGEMLVWEGEGVPRSESEPELSTTSNKLGQSASLWGSFTGSFFENPKTQDSKFQSSN